MGAAQAQNLITPEQAIQAVRQFIGDPGAEFIVQGPYADEPTGRFSLYYELTVRDDPAQGLYCVQATDGRVKTMFLHNPNADYQPNEEKSPVLSLPEAQAIAEEFARKRYLPFARGRWQLAPGFPILVGVEYRFIWYPLLSAYGTLGPWAFDVTVDGVSGRVVTYAEPPDRPILAPVVPRISLAQAKAIAAPFARYHLALVPFNEVYLQVTEDQWGVQGLAWFLNQCPNPAEDPTLYYGVLVDAMTGRIIGFSVPIGSPLRKEPPTRAVPPLPKRTVIRLRLGSPQGCLVGSSVAPVIEKGTLWVRAELLRGFGARVQMEKKGMEIRAGDKTIAGKTIGAKFRDYGWWVPLRRAASALGWQVDWLPLSQEAVVHASVPQQGGSPPSRLPVHSISR